MTLPPRQINILIDIKKDLLLHALPSADDLDAVAAVEQEIKEQTKRLESPGHSFYSMRHARAVGMGYQRFRSQELQRMARCK